MMVIGNVLCRGVLYKRRWSDDVMEPWSGTLPSLRLPWPREVHRSIGAGLQFHLGILKHSLDDLTLWLLLLLLLLLLVLLLVRLTVNQAL